MTREQLINKYVEAHADNRWLDAGELRDLLNSFADELMPSLPEGLDEAADKYTDNPDTYACWVDHYGDFAHMDDIDLVEKAFKAGAEWMAGQYKTLGETEIYLEDDGGEVPYTQEWLDLATTEFAVPDGFSPGDKVIVQIRKI